MNWQILLEIWILDPVTSEGHWLTIARGNRAFIEELYKVLQPIDPVSPGPPKGRRPRPKPSHLRIVA